MHPKCSLKSDSTEDKFGRSRTLATVIEQIRTPTNTFPEQRRQRLLDLVLATGSAEVTALATQLGVSVMTIRRDLRMLDAQGLLHRARGGALRVNSIAKEIPYRTRVLVAPEAKRRIGRYAAALIADHETVLLDAGSTTSMVADALVRAHRVLTIVTNDIRIAAQLTNRPNIRVTVAGGALEPGTYTLVGTQTQEALRDLHVDTAVLGVDAIHGDGGLYARTIEEAAVKRAMIEAADKIVVVAHAHKFAQTAFAKISAPDDIHVLITDHEPPAPLQERMNAARVQVLVAERQ